MHGLAHLAAAAFNAAQDIIKFDQHIVEAAFEQSNLIA